MKILAPGRLGGGYAFRGNIVKERKIRRAIEAALHGDKAKAEELMKIVIEQSEY